MKCCKCNRSMIENKLTMFPIEPKGTPNRKWACLECIDIKTVDKEILKLTMALHGKEVENE